MRFDGKNWRLSKTVLPLPYDARIDKPQNIRFGKICKESTKGAVLSHYTYGGTNKPVYVKPITPNGWSLTNVMYGKYYVRDGEVRVKAYLQKGGLVYTTSWVHEKKTMEYQMKKIKERHQKAILKKLEADERFSIVPSITKTEHCTCHGDTLHVANELEDYRCVECLSQWVKEDEKEKTT
jgi:hypothetical protein